MEVMRTTHESTAKRSLPEGDARERSKAKPPRRGRTTKNKFGKIGVLMGGPSSEREISLQSGQAVYEALSNAGLAAVAVDIQTDNIEENIRLLKSHNIDCAFLALHGYFGEDGTIQELLDAQDIPYTGSGVQASKLAMDKPASRKIFQKHGLNVPRYKTLQKNSFMVQESIPLRAQVKHFPIPPWPARILSQGRLRKSPKVIAEGDFLAKGWKAKDMSLPLVIKPATHGSSIGLSIVDIENDLAKALDLAFSFDERILVEEYIRGREVTVGILDERALPVIEIIPKKKFFDYEAKYKPGMTEYEVPAKLDEDIAQRIMNTGLSAHQLLGCAGCSRVDMILSNDDIPFVLEVNTIPGLTRTSLLPKAALTIGIDFLHLCLKLLELAYAKAKT